MFEQRITPAVQLLDFPGGCRRWSITVGSVAGTKVRIHITFLLLLAWIFLANFFSVGPQAAWDALLFVVLLFLCVLLHEFGHIFTARAFGISTPDVILLPIGGVSRLEHIPEKPLEHIPEKPREEFLVAVAGPAVNVVIAALLILSAGAKLGMRNLAAIENTSQGFINQLATVNLYLAVFNLIPAFPMDGGRVLRALLATRFGYVRATEIAAAVGQLVAFALGFLGSFGNPLLIFVAIFIYLAASSEAHVVAIRAMARGVPVTAAMLTKFETLTPDEHIDKAVETALHTSQGEFRVMDGMSHPIGLLARNDLIRALKERGPQASVADAMSNSFPTVNDRRCLDEAFRLLQEKSAPAVGVVDASGKLVGLVTSETIGQMLMLHQKAAAKHPFWALEPSGQLAAPHIFGMQSTAFKPKSIGGRNPCRAYHAV